MRPDEAVDFTVDLTPNTAEYFLLGYNVTGVELYRKREDEAEFTPWKSMEMIATYRAVYHWVPVEADAGTYQFAALVNTQIPTPLLEVGPNSIQPVEVSCFSAASAALVASSAPPTCADTWIGTSTVIIKTTGLPDANITSNANLTWTFDPSTSGNGTTNYTIASGSFDLAVNSADPSCTFSLSPHTFAFVKDPLTPSILSITDNGITPPVYSFLASQRVDFTSTASCAGRPDVVTPFVGFIVNFAQGGGSYTPGQTTLAGSSDDGAIESHWSFTRP